MRARARIGLGAAAAAALVAGCGPSSPPSGPDPADTADAADPGDIAVDADTVYDCFGVGGTAEEIAAAPPLDDHADHSAYDALVEAVGGDPTGWVVLEASDQQLHAIRELDTPERRDGQLRTHERVGVDLVPAASMPDTDEDTWMLSTAGSCALQAVLDGLGAASVELDPAAPPEPEDTEVALLVTEQACASGRPADGRVELADLEMTDQEVRLVIGVRPPSGAQECPSNPPTPVELELPEPLGDRELVDATVLPPRPLEPAAR